VREYARRGEIRGKIIGKRWTLRRSNVPASSSPRSRKRASSGSPCIKKPASVSIALPLDLNKIVERILQKYSDRLGLTPEQATKMLETLRFRNRENRYRSVDTCAFALTRKRFTRPLYPIEALEPLLTRQVRISPKRRFSKPPPQNDLY
jgi:hypothetical protein